MDRKTLVRERFKDRSLDSTPRRLDFCHLTRCFMRTRSSWDPTVNMYFTGGFVGMGRISETGVVTYFKNGGGTD